MSYRMLGLAIFLAGCSSAFEVGEALNKATTNIATDPARYLWSMDTGPDKLAPASAPAAETPAAREQGK